MCRKRLLRDAARPGDAGCPRREILPVRRSPSGGSPARAARPKASTRNGGCSEGWPTGCFVPGRDALATSADDHPSRAAIRSPSDAAGVHAASLGAHHRARLPGKERLPDELQQLPCIRPRGGKGRGWGAREEGKGRRKGRRAWGALLAGNRMGIVQYPTVSDVTSRSPVPVIGCERGRDPGLGGRAPASTHRVTGPFTLSDGLRISCARSCLAGVRSGALQSATAGAGSTAQRHPACRAQRVAPSRNRTGNPKEQTP
jgi:hypothetical protein